MSQQNVYNRKILYFVLYSNYGIKDIANIFFNQWIYPYQLPKDIMSNHDKKFTTNFWQQVMIHVKMHRLMTTSFHLEGDVETKHMSVTLNMYLQNYVVQEQLNWVEILPLGEFCYNTM